MDDGRLFVFTRNLHSHHFHGENSLVDVTVFDTDARIIVVTVLVIDELHYTVIFIIPLVFMVRPSLIICRYE